MSYSTGYLTTRETSIWELRRRNHTQSEIGRILGITRQAAYKTLGKIDGKVEQAFNEVAKTNDLEIKRIDVVQGIMEGYSHAYNMPVFVTLSKSNGLRIWYMHEGNCGSCIHDKNCRDYLINEAGERGIELSEQELEIPSTLLALKVFEKIGGS